MTASVRKWTDFEHRRTDCDSRSRGQILFAQIHVDVELIAGEWPAFFLLGHESRDASIHDVDLHLRMRRSVGSSRASTHVQLSPIKPATGSSSASSRTSLSSTCGRRTINCNDAIVFRRLPQMVQRRFEFLHRQVFHSEINNATKNHKRYKTIFCAFRGLS